MYIVSYHFSSFIDTVPEVCATAGALLHYFLLVAFSMMAVEAINLFMKLVIVLGIPQWLENRYVLKAGLIAWIVPIFIVVASIAPNWRNYYYSDESTKFCRSIGGPFYGGLIAPFGIIYILNWGIFIWILVSLLFKKKTSEIPRKQKSMQSKFKQNFIIALILSILFGLGWGVGLAATSSIRIIAISTTLQAIFIFLTGFQGLWIFLVHCVRSDEVRKEWKTWIYVITCHKVSFTRAKKKPKQHSNVSSSGLTGSSSKRTSLSTSYGYSNSTFQKVTKQGRESSAIEEEDVDLSLHPEESCFLYDTSTSKDPYQQSLKGAKTEQIQLTLFNPSARMSSISTEGLDLIEIQPLPKEDNNPSKTRDNFNVLWVNKTRESEHFNIVWVSEKTQSPTTMDSNDVIENTGAMLGDMELAARDSQGIDIFSNSMNLDFNGIAGTNNVFFEMQHEEDSVDIQ